MLKSIEAMEVASSNAMEFQRRLEDVNFGTRIDGGIISEIESHFVDLTFRTESQRVTNWRSTWWRLMRHGFEVLATAAQRSRYVKEGAAVQNQTMAARS